MSFNCLITDGSTLGCSTIGGVQKLWLGNWEDITGLFTQDSCGIITGITPTSAITVYEFQQDIEIAGLTQTGSFDRTQGTVFYESILSLKLFGLDCETRNRMIELGRAPLTGIVLSNAGDYYYLGAETAGRSSSSEANLGTALSDMNGLSQSISWKSANGCYLIDGTLIGTTIILG